MYCKECGTPNDDNASVCVSCGAKLEKEDGAKESASTVAGNNYNYSSDATSNNGSSVNNGNNNGSANGGSNLSGIPEEYTPISMWGYFGYELLFSIPCVGFILLLVFSFGGTKNQNLKNFARSYFCFMIIIFALFLIISLICGGAAFYQYSL